MSAKTIVAALAAACLLAGCSTVAQLGSSVASNAGIISKDQAASINKTAEAVEKTFEDLTPENEYYIGRTVGAQVLASYPPYRDAAASRYLNLLGQTLATFSDKPETYGGYHFLVLDTEEINAFAAPGGLVFASRGLLKLCTTESELAAVLAHEVAHVQYEHGLKAIKKGRLTNALTTIGVEAGKNLGSRELREVTNAFGDTVKDITDNMISKGYSRDLEYDADKGAVAILERAGYDPAALVSVLERMKTTLKPGTKGFGATHPDPQSRADRVRKLLGQVAPVAENPAGKARRVKALAGL